MNISLEEVVILSLMKNDFLKEVSSKFGMTKFGFGL